MSWREVLKDHGVDLHLSELSDGPFSLVFILYHEGIFVYLRGYCFVGGQLEGTAEGI